MNKYELCVIFKPDLEEETVKAEFEKVLELVTNNGGTVDKVDEWGKRKLAYEINKIKEGVYYFIYFNSDAGAPKKIEQRLRITESIMRFLNIRHEA